MPMMEGMWNRHCTTQPVSPFHLDQKISHPSYMHVFDTFMSPTSLAEGRRHQKAATKCVRRKVKLGRPALLEPLFGCMVRSGRVRSYKVTQNKGSIHGRVCEPFTIVKHGASSVGDRKERQ